MIEIRERDTCASAIRNQLDVLFPIGFRRRKVELLLGLERAQRI